MERIKVVYALRHEATGKVYVGSSFQVHKRYMYHVNRLKNGRHISKEMQADYDRFDDKSITLTILDQINNYSERDKEYEWMIKLKTYDRRHGYNYADPKWPRKH